MLFSMKMRKSGFTLVEMLVVIAIIGILAAVVLPAISGAKLAANASKSVNNCREIGKAMMMYVNDNKWYLPKAPEDDSTWTAGWMNIGGAGADGKIDSNRPLSDYLGSVIMFESPGDKGATGGACGAASPTAYAQYGTSYAWSKSDVGAVMGVEGKKVTIPLLKAGSAKKIIVFELPWQLNGTSTALAKKDNWYNKTKLRAACAFLDGHGEMVVSDITHTGVPADVDTVRKRNYY